MRMLPPGQEMNVGTIILENKRHIETERYIQQSDDIRSYNYEGGASKATSLNTLASGEIETYILKKIPFHTKSF